MESLIDASDAGVGLRRCAWPGLTSDYVRYHDEEWGVPIRGDVAYFERLTFESFQSGLSWLIVMRKRPAFRLAFAGFEPERVADFDDADVSRLLTDPGIIRNRRKILATITNARALRELRQREGEGALEATMLRHAPTDRELRIEGFRRPPRRSGDLPTATAASTALANLLKQRGFVFVGPTTLYAGMQANGLVDDHLQGCFRRGMAAARTDP
ncbi:MAG: DNA-3-methyladenine glycosylase I [Candidatus Nanopelagicales bacterium]